MNKLKNLIKIICFIIFWPIGIFFIIKSKHKKISKILLGIISFLIFVIFWSALLGPSNQQSTVDSGKATVNTKVDENYNVANNSNDTNKNADNTENDSTKTADNNTNANANSDSSKSNENVDNSTTTKVNNDVKNNEPKKAPNVEHKTNNQNNAERVQEHKPKEPEHKENVQKEQTGKYGFISFNSSTKKAILHSGPDSHSGDIEHLDNGEKVEILGMSGAYYRVKASDGNIGYVSDRFVK